MPGKRQKELKTTKQSTKSPENRNINPVPQDDKLKKELEITIGVLKLMNERFDFRGMIRSLVTFFKDWTEFEAVGIRLKENEDYPYYESSGFADDFIKKENSLCARDLGGQLARDEIGNPVLECMCGNILSGRFDPSKYFFTEYGSFWSNSTSYLLSTTTEEDRRARTRNRCNAEGYETVALIPLKKDKDIFGLLQLNDKRKDRLSLRTMNFIEKLCSGISVALAERKANESLCESERLYKSLFDNMLNGFAYCRMFYENGIPGNFKYLEVNEAFERLTGLKNVAGKYVTEVIPGIRETDPSLFEIYGRVALSGKPETFEMLVEALNMWFSVSVYSPEREYFTAVFDVITERKNAEISLRKSEERYRTTLDNMLEGAQIIGYDWRYLYINDAAERHNRRPKEELLGKVYSRMWPGIESTEVYSLIKRCMEQGIPSHFENEFTFPDGTKGWFDLSIQPVPEGVFILSVDITKRKAAEEEINTLYRELEKKVEERTEQLVAVNKELEAFSYSVSHDLKAPLRAIDGFSKVIMEKSFDALDDESKRYLGIIRKSSENMARLIDDLLSFSRLGRIEIKAFEVDMELLANEVVEEIKMQYPERNIEFIINPAPCCIADRSALKMALSNLFANAVKFTRVKPGATIEFGAIPLGSEAEYFVRDNGVGFDMKYKDKLFGVFQRLHRQDEFEGTGIGLALVQRIIHKHGGSVRAEGKLNEGAVFYFTLPVQGGKNE